MNLLRRRWPALVLFLAVAAAFLIRTVYSYDQVFTPAGVNFQEGDAWYHVRTVHNLLAHFPWRSGFDPYALFPSGQNVPTGPFWDYLLASLAWVLSLGSPSPQFIDIVSAWTPAILGALFPVPVFWLARRLFGDAAAAFSACWVAVIPGGFLWQTHLGYADHHVAESFLSFLAVALLCAAVESDGRAMIWLTGAAGLSLGAYLATRPAGVFVIFLFVAAAVLEPALIRLVLGMFLVAALIFIPVTGNQWADYTWICLAAGFAILPPLWVLNTLRHRRGWSLSAFLTAALLAAAIAAGVLLFLAPSRIVSLAFMIKRALGLTTDARLVASVQELLPFFKSSESTAWQILEDQLGTVWILAIPALIGVLVLAWRRKRPALTLFALWSLLFTVAAFLQVRMVTYFGVAAAMLAGVACGWLVSLGRPLDRRLAAAGLTLFLVFTNGRIALEQMETDNSPTKDWRDALAWLSQNTPEPFQDSSAWLKWHPRLTGTQIFPYPSSAYGTGVWWDFGYWVEHLGRRIPTSNGTQSGVAETARFFVDPNPVTAIEKLRASRTRYVIVDPSLPVLELSHPSQFLGMLTWARADVLQYVRLYYSEDADGLHPQLVYLPNYYRSLGMRLFLVEGQQTDTARGVPVVMSHAENRGGRTVHIIEGTRFFQTENEARRFIGGHPENDLLLASTDAGSTCVPLEELKGIHRVFTSDSNPISALRAIHAVKIFEVLPDQLTAQAEPTRN